MSYSKPFKTYEELLNKLIDEHNLEVLDKSTGIELLKTISYYDLINGYKDFFMINKKFKPGITEDALFKFLIFDKNFQSILFKYSVYAENTFKTKLSHFIAEAFGVSEHDYLDPKNYSTFRHAPKREQKKLDTLNELKKICINPKSEHPTRHYADTHNHIPPWILFKNITFNSSIDLFSFLEKNLKEKMVEDYASLDKLEIEEKKEMLKNAISIIRKFRNKIAHNAKVVTYTVEKNELNPNFLIKIYNNTVYNSKDKNKKIGKNDMFSMVISLCLMIENKFLVASFLTELKILLLANRNIAPDYISYLNLPGNFEERINELLK